MDKNMEVSVVLPCLNEEEAIGACLKKIKDVFAREGISGEIIVADNGSVDNSRRIAEKEGAKVVLEHQRGYGAAYLRGLREAKGKYILIADSDNTYDFYELPKFIALLKQGNDFVIGSRFKGKNQEGRDVLVAPLYRKPHPLLDDQALFPYPALRHTLRDARLYL